MGINRGIHDAGVKVLNPCELYAFSNTDATRDLLWTRNPAVEAPNQLRDYTETAGAEVALSRMIANPLPPSSAMWWTITAFAFETVSDEAGPATILPVNDSFLSNGLPSTEIQLVVRVRGEQIFIDIGKGTQFSVLAGNVSLGLWVPGRNVLITPNRRPNINAIQQGLILPEGFEGPVFNTSIGLNFTVGTSAVGRSGPVTCTRTYDPTDTDVPVASGLALPSPGDFVIPPRAKRVQFSVRFQDEPVPTALGVNFLSDVIARFSRGAVTQWSVGAREQTSPWADIPQNAQIINIASLTDRIVTAVWELDL